MVCRCSCDPRIAFIIIPISVRVYAAPEKRFDRLRIPDALRFLHRQRNITARDGSRRSTNSFTCEFAVPPTPTPAPCAIQPHVFSRKAGRGFETVAIDAVGFELYIYQKRQQQQQQRFLLQYKKRRE
ncbi:hypothetical protein I305_04275 [Cryptococcus gattii E566]|nr:hypothetical protein I306_00705 [Cryptococcus gattii EJB2]KIY33406.1 hypothetical protein I305_04275 [Cryptococcus gattii E566]KJD99461.1 hypothetical protein I311_06972 [Cryptococcus gattii NT-10]